MGSSYARVSKEYDCGSLGAMLVEEIQIVTTLVELSPLEDWESKTRRGTSNYRWRDGAEACLGKDLTISCIDVAPNSQIRLSEKA
jgi:hypothetical protein